MNDQSTAFIRAARGPLILITIGTLFAIDRFTQYHFSQTWPILLIVVGVLRLLGGPGRYRRDAYRDAYGVLPAPPMAGQPIPPVSPAPPSSPTPPPYDPQGGHQ
jgi:hypothetical protein